MKITITRNFGPIDRLVEVDRTILRAVGLEARRLIVERTRRGLDAEGKAFRPYSAAYAARKQAAVGTSTPVNLTASGAMLNALTIVDVDDESVTLGFSS